MYAAISPYSVSAAGAAANRVNACGRVSFKYAHGQTKLDRLFQTGAAKIRLPKTYSNFSEAVLINTSGGITGGDQLTWDVDLAAQTKATITTQASEKIYEASSGIAEVTTDINVGSGAACHWLPQEAILFEGSSLRRTLNVNLAQDARFLAIESVMLGREAMGENVQRCFFKDQWRVRRDSKLIFADDIKLNGDIPRLENTRAFLAGHKCFATLFYAVPDDQEFLDAFRGQLLDECFAHQHNSTTVSGISTFGGKLIMRMLAKNAYEMRQIMIPLLKKISGDQVPKVWRI